MLNVVARLVLTLAIALPLVAQTADEPVPAPQSSNEIAEPELSVEESRRELRVTTNSTTPNRVAKFFDSTGGVTDTLSIFEAADGKVGIGTLAPGNPLHILASTGIPTSLLKLQTNGPDSVSSLSLQNDARNWLLRVDGADGDKFKIYDGTAMSYRLTINDVGNVGIGTTAPSKNLHVLATDDSQPTIRVENTNAAGLNVASVLQAISPVASLSLVSHGNRDPNFMRYGMQLAGWSEILNFNGNGLIVGTNLSKPLVFGTNSVERMRILDNGNVGIGITNPTAKLHVIGDVIVEGTFIGTKVIGAVYQDLAEWVPASSNMEPGTVVILNPEISNEVMPSNREYDTTVAGVVSAQPGILLGVAGDSKEQIATTGRVRVRVDATRSPIRIGDLLVTGAEPGTAMKSIPVEMSGISMHRPGTIIGKALEPLDGGVGEILVLLSLQ